MPHVRPALAALVALVLAVPAAAQQRDTARSARTPTAAARAPLGAAPGSSSFATTGGGPGTGHYDVVLQVPELSVDSIDLQVDDVRAHLSLDAQVASLVMLTAGADVRIDHVGLTIAGVLAEAYLYIDLDNVAKIVDRAVRTLEQNPEIVKGLLATIDTAVGVVGNVGNTALQPGGVVDQTVGVVGNTIENVTAPGGMLSQTVNTLGQTVKTVVTTTGSIVEQTLDAAGGVASSRTLGNVLRLAPVREATNAAGRTVRQVRDQAGNLIEYTLDTAGKVANVRVLERAAGGR